MVNGAGIAIVAFKIKCAGAYIIENANSILANIHCAGVAIIADDGSENATAANTSVSSAVIRIIANNGRKEAAG